jgi:hypothetical protein
MHALRSALAAPLALIMLTGSIVVAVAQDSAEVTAETESVLFVGNSFTFWDGGVWRHVEGLAASEDPPRAIEVDALTQGGAPLASFVYMVKAEDLREDARDVVVLQGDIPENYDPETAVETFLESARTLDQVVRDGGARPVYYMTWPFILEDWMGHAGIEAAHRQIEEELDATVAPVAMAMIDSLVEWPELDMLGPDMSHPSVHGLYLAAAVIYGTIYERSPEGLAYHPEGVSEEEAAYLQRIAWEAIGAWNDGAMSPPPDAGAWVTGSISCGPDWSAEPAQVTFRDGIWAIDALTMTCRDTASDPRVTGFATSVWHCDCQYGVGSPTWGTYELEGPDGSWVGPRYGTRAMDGSGHSFAVLEGTGAYAGLTYMVDWTHQPDGSTEVEGVIFEGTPPEPTE